MADLQAMLLRLQENLNALEERRAGYGDQTPVELLNQIKDHHQAITLTRQIQTGHLTEAEWRAALRPLNIDHTLIEGGFFQKILQAISLAPEQQGELRNRQLMLRRVHEFWIRGVLESSLHQEVLIELALEERKEAVEYPWETVIQPAGRSTHLLPAGTNILDVFDETGGSLLILGEPGSGKTTMLLDLGRQLIGRARDDPSQPMPVVFNLSTWAEKRLPLSEWLVEELAIRYVISVEIARQWIDNQSLVLLLDGLDEVAARYRDDCIGAINAFQQAHMVALVVCCRTFEYQASPIQLRLQNSIALRGLTLEQVYSYLEKLGPEVSTLQITLLKQKNLQTLARSPLMLGIMVMVYQHLSTESIPPSASEDTVREYLFAAYVKRMFDRRGVSKQFTAEQTIKWLSFLARTMKDHAQSTLFIEQIRPSWLPSKQQQRFYEVGLRLIGGSLFFLVSACSVLLAVVWSKYMIPGYQTIPLDSILGAGFASGLAFVLASIFAKKRWQSPLIALVTGIILLLIRLDDPVTFLMAGIIFGLPGAIAGAPLARHQTVQVSDALHWSWRRAIWGIVLGVGIGLIAAGIGDEDRWANALEIGIPVGLILIVILGIRRVEDIKSRHKPNQGLDRSVQHGIRVGLSAVLFVILLGLLLGFFLEPIIVVAFVLLMGGSVGLSAGLYVGGNAAVQYGLLKYMLYRDGLIAWQLIDFLDYAVDRIFLHNIGPGYIFFHQWLQDYFIRLDPD